MKRTGELPVSETNWRQGNKSSETTRSPGREDLQSLYLRHGPSVFRLAYVLTRDRALAEDLTQEAFVRLASRFRHIRAPEAIPGYLRQTLINLVRNHTRRRAIERSALSRIPVDGGRSSSDEVDERRDILARLQLLPQRQRTAIVLRFYEDLPESEVARLLGVSVKAVNSLVSRGLKGLRSLEGDVQ